MKNGNLEMRTKFGRKTSREVTRMVIRTNVSSIVLAPNSIQ